MNLESKLVRMIVQTKQKFVQTFITSIFNSFALIRRNIYNLNMKAE